MHHLSPWVCKLFFLGSWNRRAGASWVPVHVTDYWKNVMMKVMSFDWNSAFNQRESKNWSWTLSKNVIYHTNYSSHKSTFLDNTCYNFTYFTCSKVVCVFSKIREHLIRLLCGEPGQNGIKCVGGWLLKEEDHFVDIKSFIYKRNWSVNSASLKGTNSYQPLIARMSLPL